MDCWEHKEKGKEGIQGEFFDAKGAACQGGRGGKKEAGDEKIYVLRKERARLSLPKNVGPTAQKSAGKKRGEGGPHCECRTLAKDCHGETRLISKTNLGERGKKKKKCTAAVRISGEQGGGADHRVRRS